MPNTVIKPYSSGISHNQQIEFIEEQCCSCGIPFFMPVMFYNQKKKDKSNFHCPNGHPQHYTISLEEKLRSEYAGQLQDKDELIEQTFKDYQELDRDYRKLKRECKPKPKKKPVRKTTTRRQKK